MSQVGTATGLIVAALAATIAFQPVLQAQAAEERRVVVEIHKFTFVPETVVVSSGDVVVWKNMDIVPHTATSKDDGWNSGRIEAGGEWATIITDDMRGQYYCSFHPSMLAIIDIKSE